MKRRLSLLIMVLACLAVVAGILVACNPTSKELTFYDRFENGKVYYVITTESGGEITLPEDPVMKGYSFVGWYEKVGLNSYGRTSYKLFDASEYTAESDLDLFARWQSDTQAEQQPLVTYYDAEGAFIESDIVDYGAKPSLVYIDGALSEGETLVGWKEAATGDIWYFDGNDTIVTDTDFTPVIRSATPSSDVRLTAKNATVSSDTAQYDLSSALTVSEEWARVEIKKDGILVGNSADPVVDLAYGDNVFEVRPYYESNGKNVYCGASVKVTVTREVGRYNVIFNYIEADEGAIRGPVYADKDGYISEPANINLEKEGYVFVGWQVRNGKGGAGFWDFDNDVVTKELFESANDDELILYACYEPVPYFVAKFVVNDENVENVEALKGDSVVSVMIDSVMKLPTAVKEHYDFIGWKAGSFELKVGENIFVYGDSAVTCGTWGEVYDESISDVTFTPIFEPHKYTVTYELNGGTNNNANPETYTVEDTAKDAVTLQDPVKAGYKFTGWDNGQTLVEAIEAGSTEDIKLTATWEKINYKITYKLNGGKNSDDNPSEYDIEDKTIVLKDPEKAGYEFTGWYNGQTRVEAIEAGSTGDIELTAKWEKINYKIIYIVNGGKNSNANPATYTVEDAVTLQDPEKAGYEFKGWYNGQTQTPVKAIKAGSVGDIVLYAKWELTA